MFLNICATTNTLLLTFFAKVSMQLYALTTPTHRASAMGVDEVAVQYNITFMHGQHLRPI